MEPNQELIDTLYREEIRRAREMPPEEKLFQGIRLFEQACRIMSAGIRDEFPNADEEEVQRILKARLARIRALEWGR